MLRVVLLIALLGLQIRPPSTLRQPATPPAEGTGTFQQHSYTFKRESIYYVLEFTPMLPARRATVLEAMKAACQGLYGPRVQEGDAAPGTGARRVDPRDGRPARLLRAANAEPRRNGGNQDHQSLDAVTSRAVTSPPARLLPTPPARRLWKRYGQSAPLASSLGCGKRRSRSKGRSSCAGIT